MVFRTQDRDSTHIGRTAAACLLAFTRIYASLAQTMATFARSNRVVFNVIIGVVAFLFFMSLYHVSYNYDDIMDKVNGKA